MQSVDGKKYIRCNYKENYVSNSEKKVNIISFQSSIKHA